ncbi:hypothetical protein AbraIFM66951_008743 [Aspergillus brasiliensis]|uniref:Ubiquitin 3 binding protein But2 C-terminal domain-containing protein n=2 Tax=Aspergillus brasiliensis TaxID=319629 RepID=A0A1L9U2I9_ASPBC|nr:hypothetical protein ASPBRDRAFT_60211 [Aspergillus brasiliensis CBS 101740]GKZ21792.1 hypothetical protein AbraCBS73388_007707 [Aspergillus brasiliensis]GKZ45875.1 hypothetical protein AbraIFM66951_008743 [Aspergillus brasiliensis]
MKLALLPVLFSTSVLGLNIGRGQSTAQVTFIGAANAQFSQDFPTDGSTVKITNPLSISHISVSTPGAVCTFDGIDHSVTTVTGVGQVDVGPPQTQTQGSCRFGSAPSNPGQTQPTGGEVLITFIGAANAQFQQQFPTNGASTKITNPLSISHISSTTGGVQCTFDGIDHSVTTVNGAQTVDVGPPQTQISGACHAV